MRRVGIDGLLRSFLINSRPAIKHEDDESSEEDLG